MDDFSVTMFNTMFKTRKTMVQVLTTDKIPGTVKKLWILGTLMILFVVVMVFVQHEMFVSKFTDINTNISYLNSSYVRIAEAENI